MSAPNPLAGLRVGFGLAVALSGEGPPARLGGVELGRGRDGGREDADVASDAASDALLSACGLPEMETLLDPVELAGSGADAYLKLSNLAAALRRRKLEEVLNLDVKLAGALPLPERERVAVINNLAAALGILPAQVSLSFTSHRLMPPVDQGRAVVAFAHVLCCLRTPGSTAGRVAADGWTAPERAAKPGEPREETPAGRPHEFERAMRTKLPPLPPAPPPRAGDTLIAYADGASRGNPGPAAAGWIVLDAQGRLVGEGSKALGGHTNNEAEYLAVQEMARWVESALGLDFNLLVRMDSELVVKQLRGEYKVKDPELKQLALQTMTQLMYFTTFNLAHVPRIENARADALANRELDQRRR